jgi:hypothetical protein
VEEMKLNDDWNMMTENIARNAVLHLIRDAIRYPTKYNEMGLEIWKAIDNIQEAFKRKKIA